VEISAQDKEILRELGKRYREIAELPVQKETITLWKAINSLKPVRPMVMIDQLPWHELNAEGELTLKTSDPFCRNIETKLRRELYKWKHFRTDMVIEPVLRSSPVVEGWDFGIKVKETEKAVTDVNNDVVGHFYNDQIKEEEDIQKIITRALTDKECGLGKRKINIAVEAVKMLETVSNGDARTVLNILEVIDALKTGEEYSISIEDVKQAADKKTFLYDKAGEEHYNIISALHKSMRDSDPDAAIYWALRMLEAGEDPLYVIRRVIRFASEDVGNADPNALIIANAAKDTYHFLGSPEGELAIAQAIIYIACAPKSNAAYMAYTAASEDVKNTKNDPVPLNIRNAPTKLMKDLGYGKGYKYAHDYEGHFVNQQHLPDSIKDNKYYFPTENGTEKNIKERLEKWRKQKD